MKNLFAKCGLENIDIKRLVWVENFENGGKTFDFFASTSGLWWYDQLPTELRERETIKTRRYFERKKVNHVTTDIVCAYATKK